MRTIISNWWPFNRKPPTPRPWYKQGYVRFPLDEEEIAIIMGYLDYERIIRLNNSTLTVCIEENKGTYLNRILCKIEIAPQGYGVKSG